jgi:hypothetical protein
MYDDRSPAKSFPNPWQPQFPRAWQGQPYPYIKSSRGGNGTNIHAYPGEDDDDPTNPCSPPYCNLGSGWCGCCSCCPPYPCYTSWTYIYECGTNYETWGGVGENEGCPCEVTILGEDANDFVFALNCAVPCTTHAVTLTTTGCCLYRGESDFEFTAIGGGTVSLEVDNSEVCDGDFIMVVNNSGTSAEVSDCGEVGIYISSSTNECCDCCLVSSSGTLLNGQMSLARRRVQTGLRKTIQNKRQIALRIKKQIKS